MLKTLVLINLKRLFVGMNRASRKKGMTVVIALLLVYAVVVFAGMFGSMFYTVYGPYHEAGLDWFYFSLAGLMSFGMCFVFSIFSTKSQLFEAKDNDLLLSMPIKPMTILISRVISLLVLNYIYSGIVLIPALVAYLIDGSLPALGIVNYVIVFLTLPLLSLALSCLLGWVLALVTSRMRSKNIITLAMSMAFFVGYFWVYSHMYEYMQSLVDKGESMALAVQKAMFPAYHLGRAIAEGNAVSLIIFLLTAIIPFAAVMYILSRSFISIATENRGASKAVYREKRMKVSGAQTALFKKDLRAFLASPMYIMNGAMGTMFAVGLPILAAVKFKDIAPVASALGSVGLSPAIIASAVVCMCVVMNFVSAPSVSLEGKNLWIARTLPVPSGSILLSKALLHFAVTEPGVVFATVVFAALFKPSPVELLIMLLLPTAANAFCAFLGVAVNLRFPRFDWTSEVQVIKQSMTTFVTMLLSFFAVLLPAGVYWFAFIGRFSLTAYAAILTAVYAFGALLLCMYLMGSGSRRFESLS